MILITEWVVRFMDRGHSNRKPRGVFNLSLNTSLFLIPDICLFNKVVLLDVSILQPVNAKQSSKHYSTSQTFLSQIPLYGASPITTIRGSDLL